MLGGPTKCTFHYLFKEVVYPASISTVVLSFIIVFVVPHVNERTLLYVVH